MAFTPADRIEAERFIRETYDDNPKICRTSEAELCCGCDRPIETDWCPRCRDMMGRWNPDTAPYCAPTRIEKLLAARSREAAEQSA